MRKEHIVVGRATRNIRGKTRSKKVGIEIWFLDICSSHGWLGSQDCVESQIGWLTRGKCWFERSWKAPLTSQVSAVQSGKYLFRGRGYIVDSINTGFQLTAQRENKKWPVVKLWPNLQRTKRWNTVRYSDTAKVFGTLAPHLWLYNICRSQTFTKTPYYL